MKQCSITYNPGVLLIDQVESVFKNQNLPFYDFIRKSRDLHPDALKMEADHGIQRFLINRVLRMQLGLFEENTIVARSCLIDNGSFEDWLRLLETEVAPCLLRNLTQAKIN